MDGSKFNRIATSVLLASFVILLVSNIVDLIYEPDSTQSGGYSVDVGKDQEKVTESSEAKPGSVDLASLMAAADATKGKEVARKCAACHTFNKGGQNKVGPNLWEVIGAPKCRVSGFTYSKALLSKGGNWTEEELFEFLSNPRAYASGTRMSFAGLAKPQDIANLLAYIKSLEQEEAKG